MSDPAATWIIAPLLNVVDLHDGRRVPLNAAERAMRQGNFPYYGANGLVDHVNDYIFDGDFVLLAEDGGNFDRPERGWPTRFQESSGLTTTPISSNLGAKWPRGFFDTG